MRRAVAVLALVAVGLVSVPPPAHAATHQVRVEDNVFTPKLLEIEPGDSVAWSALRAGHTITADDGRFDFHPNRTVEVGEQVSWRFEAEGDVRYYCKIHGGPGGQGMSGVIRVGGPPTLPAPEASTLIVPDDVATIGQAAAGAQPGTEVLVRPGSYAEEVTVTVPRLTIRGLGTGPDGVMVRGDDARDVGITVAAPGVRIENLTVTGHRGAGIAVGTVVRTVIADVVLRDNGLYGVDARGASGVTIRDAHVTGHGIAGIGVRDCVTCGALIERAAVEGNAAGVVAVAATGVVVRSSLVRGNAVGVVLRDVVGSQVTANELTNNAANVWVASALDGAEPPTGAGVWVSGGRGNLVASNTATGHTYNVVVTGPSPGRDHRVVRNTLGDAIRADLGWDGVGVGVCFRENRSSDEDAPTSHPPVMAVSDCSQPATAGVPYPVVTANLLVHARSGGYPI